MKYDVFLNRTANLIGENRLLKFVIVVLAISNIIFGFLTFRAVSYQKVVLIPIGLKNPIELTGDYLSEAYVLEMARMIFDLAFNYSPATIKAQYELLLTMWDPETYPRYRRKFSAIEDEAQTGKLVSVFIPQSIQHDPKRKIIRATGKHVLLLEGEKVAESKMAEFAFTYRIRAGRLFIKDMGEWSEVKGTIPSEQGGQT
ncbi:sex pilus assembly/synthesis protein [Thermodesulfatator indicus DSM 15286]|uniref:Sex pilus assembly/synthesis protein n=1 Tax=Thermodesulfatator indicus (strain DSM 15286 / JCM 11887 / CIR29812) TaxID=667014 RepID=F8ACL1_THEID|nr:type IV conjugative transfer system protein TraE [Thermodesulfatator indicus]AEH45786.1 sex pilus assembly/synthesis protein [Thermodesulfatator indicus DSM 15286]